MTTNGRVISAKLFVKWTGSSVYIDESANVAEFSGQIRLNPLLTTILANRSIVDQVTITLHNKDKRYSSLLSSAGLYSAMSDGNYYQSPMYLQVSVDGGANYYTVFTGVVKYVTEATPTAKEVGKVTLDCRSYEETIMLTKLSTLASAFKAGYDGAYTERDILAAWLDAAGVPSTNYALDPGLFCIPFAWLHDESPIESAWDLASACGGRFYMRHSDGKLVYENSTSLVGKSVVTSIDRSLFANLNVKYPDQNLYKTVSVTVYSNSIKPLDKVFELNKPLQVAGSATVTKDFDLDSPVLIFTALTYKASTTGGTDITSDVTITATQYAQRLSLSIANANSNAAYIRLLAQTGYAVETDSAESITTTSSNGFWSLVGERTREIANKWVQADAQAASLANMVLTATETPLVALEISDYLGNPQLKVGDIISVQDTKIQSSNDVFYVTAISSRFNNTGYFQNLECVQLQQLAPYYGISPGGYFILGSSTLGSSGASRGRLFF